MKKLVLLLFVLGLFQLGYAQSNQLDKAAQFGADYICECVNNVYYEVDQDVREVMMNITIMDETEVEEYMLSLPEELLLRIVDQGEFMADENTVAEMDACGQRMEEKLMAKFGDLSASEDELLEAMLMKLESDVNCEFAYFLVLVGLASEEDPNNENNNTINNNTNRKPKPNPNNNVNHGGGGTDGQ